MTFQLSFSGLKVIRTTGYVLQQLYFTVGAMIGEFQSQAAVIGGFQSQTTTGL